VLASAVLVGRPLAVLAGVVEVEHGRDGVHPEPVDVVLLEPVQGVGDDSTARLWEFPSLQEKARLQHRNSVLTVALSSDGRLLATGSRDGTAHIWSVATGKETARFVHEDRVNAVAFSPDGRWLATGSADS
jgi:WD40 repeat protein